MPSPAVSMMRPPCFDERQDNGLVALQVADVAASSSPMSLL